MQRALVTAAAAAAWLFVAVRAGFSTLEVVRPSSLSSWQQGQDAVIEWRTVAANGAPTRAQRHYRVELIRSKVAPVSSRLIQQPGAVSQVAVIAENVGASGRFVWRVPTICLFSNVDRVGEMTPCFPREAEDYFVRFTRLDRTTGFVFPEKGFAIRPRRLMLVQPVNIDPLSASLGAKVTFSAGDQVTVAWRLDERGRDSPFSAEYVKIALHHRERRLKLPMGQQLVAKGDGAVNISLPLDQPSCSGYQFGLEVYNDRGLPIRGLEAHSPIFALQGPRLVFTQFPDSSLAYELGDKLPLSWQWRHVPNSSARPSNVKLVLRSAHFDVSIPMLKVDPARREAAWTIPVSVDFLSGEYTVVAFDAGGAELGRSRSIMVYGFRSYLLFPFPRHVRALSTNFEHDPLDQSALLALEIGRETEIRWSFRNPASVMTSVTVQVSSLDGSWTRTIRADVPLGQFKRHIGSLKWALGPSVPLETPLVLEIIPNLLQTTPMPQSKRRVFCARSAPFVATMSADTQSSGPGSHPQHMLAFFRSRLIEFNHAAVFHSWKTHKRTRLPAASWYFATSDSHRESHPARLVLLSADAFPSRVFQLPVSLKGIASNSTLMFEHQRRPATGMVLLAAIDPAHPHRPLGVGGPYWISSPEVLLLEPERESTFHVGESLQLTWLSEEVQGPLSGGDNAGPSRMAFERVDGDPVLRGTPPPKNVLRVGEHRQDGLGRGSFHIPCMSPPGKYAVFDTANGRGQQLASFHVISPMSGFIRPLRRDIWRMGDRARVAWIVDHPRSARDRTRIKCSVPPLGATLSIQLVWGASEAIELAQVISDWRGGINVKVPRHGLEQRMDYRIVIKHLQRKGQVQDLVSEPFVIAKVPVEEYADSFAAGEHEDDGVFERPKLGSDSRATTDNAGLDSSQNAAPSNEKEEAPLSVFLYIFSFGLVSLCAALAFIGIQYRRELRYIFIGGAAEQLVSTEAASQPTEQAPTTPATLRRRLFVPGRDTYLNN